MSSSTLTPYLQLSHILSLTWLAYPILSLVFVLFRLQLSLASSQEAVANAKGDLLTSCKAAEQAATAAASMPRYMAIATNQQFADAINGTMNAARAALVLSLTVMEGIINFLIDLWRSTFLCFLELVIRGGLAILIGAVNELNELIASAANGLRTSIQEDIAGANNIIQGAIDLINRANPFEDITAPQISVPSLDALQNVQLPSSFTDSLNKLNDTLPTFGDIKDKIEEIISKPFEEVKLEINETFTGLNFDAQTLPVPQQNTVTFCDQLDTSVVDDLGRDLIKIAKIGTVVLVLLILLLIGLNCLLQWYKWRCLKNQLEYTRQAWMTDPTMIHPKANVGGPQVTLSDHNLLILQSNASHPLLTRICNTLTAHLNLSPTTHTHLQWFFNYIFHSPALACFLIGFFGLLSVQIQLWALGPLTAQYSDRAASTVTDFSNTIATSINNSMYNQSSAYANEINARVDAAQSTINEGVFGWVNSTTTGLNATINELYTDLQNAVETAFGGTILEQPAQEFIRCLIGSKVDAIENALTFMHDNLRVDMPRVNESVLVLDQKSVDEATRPIAVAAIGGGDGDDQGLVGRLVNSYADALRKELVMFGIFMALWGVVVLMGLCVVLWHSVGRDLLEKRRRRRFHKEQRAGINGLVVPFREPVPSGPVTTRGPIHLNFNSSDGNRRDDTSSIGDEEKAWDSYFGSGQQGKGLVQPAISGPMKLMALGRTKVQGQKETSQPTWYKRITGILHRKPVPSQEMLDQRPHQKGKPNLTIAVERGRGPSIDELPQVLSSTGVSPHHDTTTVVAAAAAGPQSRWSTSPTTATPHRSCHLKNLLSPTRKAADPHSIAVPILPPQPRSPPPLKGGASQGPMETAAAAPTYFAPPLYYGFNATPPPGLQQPPQYRKFNDHGNKETSPPPPLMSPKLVQPAIALAPPPLGKYQGAGTAVKGILKNGTGAATTTKSTQLMTSANNNPYHTTTTTDASRQPRKNTVAAGNDTAVTPVTKFFSTHHARQSSSINPFLAPFEDDQQLGRGQVSGWSGIGGQNQIQHQGQGQRQVHHARTQTNSSLISMSIAPYGGIAV